MDPKFEQVLNSLPPKKARLRLEPCRELIREMRKRRYSYRQIAHLQDHFGLRVAASTVNNFVISRLNTKNGSKRNRQVSSRTNGNHKESLDSFSQPNIVQETLRYAEYIKQPTRSQSERPGAFHYEEEEPLRIIRKSETPPTTSPRNRNGA